jgi:hypothetical protein
VQCLNKLRHRVPCWNVQRLEFCHELMLTPQRAVVFTLSIMAILPATESPLPKIPIYGNLIMNMERSALTINIAFN